MQEEFVALRRKHGVTDHQWEVLIEEVFHRFATPIVLKLNRHRVGVLIELAQHEH